MTFSYWDSVSFEIGPFDMADLGSHFYTENEILESSKQVVISY